MVDNIEEVCYTLPYFYFKDCAYGNEDPYGMRKEMNPYFSHSLLLEGKISDHFMMFPWNDIGRTIGLPNNKMFRAHMTLQYPKPDREGIPHNAHVDKPGKKHWVVNMNRETQYKIIFQALFKKEFRNTKIV